MRPPDRCAASGVTLIELLVVLAIIGAVLGTAMLILPSAISLAKADSGSSQAFGVLRTCREQAITERRSIEVSFDLPNTLVCRRREIDAAGAPTGVLTETQSLLMASGWSSAASPACPTRRRPAELPGVDRQLLHQQTGHRGVQVL